MGGARASERDAGSSLVIDDSPSRSRRDAARVMLPTLVHNLPPLPPPLPPGNDDGAFTPSAARQYETVAAATSATKEAGYKILNLLKLPASVK